MTLCKVDGSITREHRMSQLASLTKVAEGLAESSEPLQAALCYLRKLEAAKDSHHRYPYRTDCIHINQAI